MHLAVITNKMKTWNMCVESKSGRLSKRRTGDGYAKRERESVWFQREV